jgi:hypothetical protein
LRTGLARWFGRGDKERERAALDRLDAMADEIRDTGDGEAEDALARQAAAWRAHVVALLRELDAAERDAAGAALRDLLASGVQPPAPAGASVIVQGDIHASEGAIAVGLVSGDVTLTNPLHRRFAPRAERTGVHPPA